MSFRIVALWALALLLTGWLMLRPAEALAMRLESRAARSEPTTLSSTTPEVKPPGSGEPLPRIVCQEGVEAYVYAANLRSPGGLAFDPNGVLHVAEENAGRVSRISPDGTASMVIDGLDYPEGIAFDPSGNLYVVEDVKDGRLVRVDPQGQQTVLATGLDAPEGVIWAPDGHLYLTESNVQFAENLPWDVVSGVTRVMPGIDATEVFTDSLLWSYSGLALGPDGLLYVANEASNVATADSVFQVDPTTGERTVFVSDLTAPEGLHFSPGGGFPLYVTEEDLGDGTGRLNLVEQGGAHRVICSGFRTPEGVAVDAQGHLYVTDQDQIVQIIAPDLVSPGSPGHLIAYPQTWASANEFGLTWQNPVDASGIAGVYLRIGQPPSGPSDGTYFEGQELSQITGITVPGPGLHQAYLWLLDGAGNADHGSAASTELRYDPDPPGGPAGLVAQPGGWSPANSFSLSWSNPAEISGVVTACYRSGSPPTAPEEAEDCQGGAGIQSLAGLSVPGSGEHTAYVWLGDAAGNMDPATAVSVTLHLDELAPVSEANAPASTATAPIWVRWAATDTHSGLERIALWVKKGDAGTWMDSGQREIIEAATGPGQARQGTFLFMPWGQDTYYFATRAVDRAGNTEAEPAGAGQTRTECLTWQRVYLPLIWREN